jgi:integrase/recombinase XerD
MVAEHLDHLTVRGYSSSTVADRSTHLARFAGWATDRGLTGPAQVTLSVLETYQRHLFHLRKTSGQPLSFRTQSQRLIPLKTFFAWAARTHRIAANPASELVLPKQEQRLPADVLTADEAEQVMAVPDVATPLGLRDRAVLEVLYSTAIRRAELARLHLGDVDPARGVVAVRQGKGAKDRFVPISSRALAWTAAYLDQVRPGLVVPPDPQVLFLAVDGQGIGVDWLSRTVKTYIETSGVEKTGSCHLLRHSAATSMLEGGADIRYVAEMLGHAKLETTQIYTRVSIHQLRAVHAATHPTARPHQPDTPGADTPGEALPPAAAGPGL